MSSAKWAIRHWWIGAAAMAVLAVVAVAMAVQATSWRQEYADEGRLLPRTTISGIDVGGEPLEVAQQVAQSAGEAALDRSVSIESGYVEQEVTARELGATTDAETVATAAQNATIKASWPRAFWVYWFGQPAFDRDVQVQVPEKKIQELVQHAAEDIDQDPKNATVDWAGEELQLRQHDAGQRVRRDTAVHDVRGALEGATDRVAIPVEQVGPAITTDMVKSVLPAVRSTMDSVLDRTVTLRNDEKEWRVSPRELGALPDPGPVVEVALAETGVSIEQDDDQSLTMAADSGIIPGIAFTVPDARMGSLLDEIAEQVEVAPRDAALDYSSGWVEVEAERPGRVLDRDATAGMVLDAFAGASDTVEIPLRDAKPKVTADEFDQVLLVRLDERRLYLYRDGEIAKEWPVAIGQPGYDTPTGEFEIGEKREAPTWTNPAPDGWGAGMPAEVGPGPNNPLGLRALNWDEDDEDTLIRFHGTAEVGSIGTAASHGCVRLHNEDILELFDLVDSGTPIVSVNG